MAGNGIRIRFILVIYIQPGFWLVRHSGSLEYLRSDIRWQSSQVTIRHVFSEFALPSRKSLERILKKRKKKKKSTWGFCCDGHMSSCVASSGSLQR